MNNAEPAERIQEISQNIERVNQRIARAAESVGRRPASVKVVVVSKLHTSESILAAIKGGAHRFGENYAEEAVEKISLIPKLAGVEWHMIGHIQSRKARLVAEYFDMVQSIDSLKIAERLNTVCGELNRRLPVLIEFNLSGEESKHGWSAKDESAWPDLISEIAQVTLLPNLVVKGLMTMPPLFDDPEMTRPFFKRLVKLRDYLSAKVMSVSWEELSMGTSNDFDVAIQEGATIVRVGQAILGPRPIKLVPL